MNIIRTSLFGLLALPMAAQSTGFNVGASLILAPKEYFGSYEKVTHNNAGYLVNAGYDMNIYQTDVPARATFTLAVMPGMADKGLKTSLYLAQLAGDIFLQTSTPELRGVIGISLNSYRAEFSGTEDWRTSNSERHFPFKDCKGIKFGFRVGLEYAITKQLSGELLLQQTELAGKPIAGDSFVRKGGINPSWLQVGVHYRF